MQLWKEFVASDHLENDQTKDLRAISTKIYFSAYEKMLTKKYNRISISFIFVQNRVITTITLNYSLSIHRSEIMAMFKMDPDGQLPPNNPWDYKFLEDFLFFMCPECSYNTAESTEFITHAQQMHPMAENFLNTYQQQPLEITLDDESDDDDVDPPSFVDCNAATGWEFFRGCTNREGTIVERGVISQIELTYTWHSLINIMKIWGILKQFC